jgi:acyl transferase domain-containing protein
MMGRELIHQDNTFSRSLHRSQQILVDLGASWRLIDELLRAGSESRINSSELSQPATTAIQIALLDMLTEMNVRPSAVLGHSSGEVAAAYAAGILNHVEALTIAYHKGFVASWCRETDLSRGAMLAVGLGEVDALKYIQRGQMGRCSVACVNSPSSVTLSGDEPAIGEVQKLLNKDSVFNRRLKVDIAYHSHHMAVVSERFYDCILGVSARRANDSVGFFSSVTGSQVLEPLGASYWVDNLVSQVRFAPALGELVTVHSKSTSQNLALLEVGPHSALHGPIRQIMMNATGKSPVKWSYVPSMVRNKDAHVAALEMVGTLFEQGVALRPTTDLSSPTDNGIRTQSSVLTNLPTYPWDHSDSNHYWHESRLSKEYRFREHPPHDLCGLRLTGTSTIEPVFRHILSVDDLPWLQEHIIDGFALYPGSAFLCMGIEALRQVSKDRGEKREIARYVFRDVSFSKALVVPDSPGSIEVLLSLRPSKGEWEEFRITSVGAEGGWSEHCKGYIMAEFRGLPTDNEDEMDPQAVSGSISETHLASMRQICQETLTSDSIYSEMRKNGIDYGESFSIIREMQLGDHKALGHLQVPDIKRKMPSQHMQPHIIHPAVFDAFMHVVLPLYHRHCSQGPVMLTSIGEVSVSADILNAPGDELVAACELTKAARRHGSVDVAIFQFDAEGKPVEVASLAREDFRAIGEGAFEKASVAAADLPPPCYHLDWVPAPLGDSRILNGKKIDLHDVNVSCLPETLLTLELVNGMSSYLATSEDGGSHSALANGNVERPSSAHIVFIDDLNALPAPENLISRLRQGRSTLLVTISPGRNSGVDVTRLAQEAQKEIEDAHIVSLDYQDTLSSEKASLYDAVIEVLHRSFGSGIEKESPVDHEYIYRDGRLLVPRLEPDTAANQWLTANVTGESITTTAAFHDAAQPLELHFTTPGLFDSAVFVPVSDTPGSLNPDEVSVKVYAHGVNALDIAIALDRAEPTAAMMGEFAGVVVDVGEDCRDLYRPGDRVCGWGAKPYTNTAVVKRDLVHRLDESIPFAEGASIPVAFVTAMYALDTIASLEHGQTVLIHGAASEIGQAAISLAEHIGAEAYATVDSRKETELLAEQARIPSTRIFLTSSTPLKGTILQLTGGKGVDVILDCSPGGLIDESVPLVADFGYVIDIANSRPPQTLGTRLERNVTFASVNLQLLATRRPKHVERLFSKLMTLYQSAKLRLLTPLERFSLADIGPAFRLMQSQRSSGKIVLESDDTTAVKQVAPSPQPPVLVAHGVYAVVGGSPALNHTLCTFLEQRGAGQIISVMASIADSEQEILDFSRYLLVKPDDIASLGNLSSAISCSAEQKLKGILHVEWVPTRRDSDQITEEEFQTGTAKMQETRAAVANIAENAALGFCVTLASCADVFGSQDHALHTTGSAVNELSAPNCRTIRLDAIEGVEAWDTKAVNPGAVKLNELYNLLDYSITAAAQQSSEKPRELFTGLTKATCPRANPIFKAIRDAPDETAAGETQSSVKRIDQQITSAENMEEVHQIVLEAAVQQLSAFLALDVDDINGSMSIASLGLDSLLAIEFKNWLVRTTQAPVQTSEVLDAPSLKHLVELVMKRSKLVQKTNGTPDGDTSTSAVKVNGTSNGYHAPEPAPANQTPPPLPIPSLESLIDRHLSYLRAHATDAEYQTTLSLASDFQAPGSIGQQLYDRLKTIQSANPETWYHDLYLRNQYLVRNGSLAPYMTFFFTHPMDAPRHSQAERAALVVSTVIGYKDRLERELIQPRVVNEEPLCMDLYKYLFNTTREPAVAIDKFLQYPGSRHFVVLRRGQVYKVCLDQVDRLERLFERILLETDESEVDWLGILTADDRISWAKVLPSPLIISQY